MANQSNSKSGNSRWIARSASSERLAKISSGKSYSTVKGGCVVRDVETGRFFEVQTKKGVAKASAISRSSVKEASSKRGAALKRLADR